ncbi:MAG: transposase, partial [Spirochaetes bacterium]|nr:transposase [Spirochaetota bacterium]
LDEFIIMPNHIHGIIEITRRDVINHVPTNEKNPMLNPYSLSAIIRWFKGRTTFEIHRFINQINFKWQSRFYDHIIRDDDDLNNIREYIIYNHLKWIEDDYYMM